MTSTVTTDWRLAIPESRRRHLRIWFWAVAAMTLGVLIVGGITRLTLSGLSIVDWDPIMGVIPPLTHAHWQEAFERYQQFPEYQQVRQGMTLGQFKFIFFWEYLHRLLARSIGLVFLLPFVFFWLRGYLNRPLAARALALFGLGLAQGVMGWLMVASGLVDRPSVSHFRLAAHLSLAFAIFGYSIWLTRELRVDDSPAILPEPARRSLRRAVAAIGAVFALQVIWGAFVAGLKAGHIDTTFPLMGGRLVPSNLLWLEPALVNFVQNPVAVQWVHRLVGTALLLLVLGVAARLFRTDTDPASRRFALGFVAVVAFQYLLGVLTLIHSVPVALGVAHQATALLILGLWVAWAHHTRTLRSPATRPHAAGDPGGQAVPR